MLITVLPEPSVESRVSASSTDSTPENTKTSSSLPLFNIPDSLGVSLFHRAVRAIDESRRAKRKETARQRQHGRSASGLPFYQKGKIHYIQQPKRRGTGWMVILEDGGLWMIGGRFNGPRVWQTREAAVLAMSKAKPWELGP